MASPLPASSKLTFGAFQLDAAAGKLFKNGIPLKLQPQPFRVLLLLAERSGAVVTREEIQRCLWGDSTFVDFERGINFSINQIRGVLNDKAGKPGFIETLPRIGYRFIPPVVADGPNASTTHTSCEPIPSRQVYEWPAHNSTTFARASAATEIPVSIRRASSAWWKRNYLRTVTVTAVVVVVVVLIAWMLRRDRVSQSLRPASDMAVARSLAVLPLENLSGISEQDYFADGMTDALITSLGQIGALRVISRTSVMQYKGIHKPLPQIARELNVDTVVEGTVLRSGDRVRITAQLIQAATDKHLWAESYEGDLRDVLGLQNGVASAIAKQILVRLTPQQETRLGRTYPVSAHAYELYLKGEFFLNRFTPSTVSQSISYFQQAIDNDPNYPPAYIGMAAAYHVLGNMAIIPKKVSYPKAKLLVAKALELDPQSAGAHAEWAWGLLYYDFDFVTAGQEFSHAVELNPNSPDGHQGSGNYYATRGQLQQAVLEMQHARDLDPLSLMVNTDLCMVLYFARRYDEALAQCKTTLELDPRSSPALRQFGAVYAAKGMGLEASLAFLQAHALEGDSPAMIAAIRRGEKASGLRGHWQVWLKSMRQEIDDGKVDPIDVAVAYAYSGNDDKALVWLERSFEARCYGVTYLGVDPTFDGLRSNPRFVSLLRRIGLPL
jgi:TolB-like protein/DNA-binding winged helix-turn-helix (wHTH) protein